MLARDAELASIYVQLVADDASVTTGNIYGAGGGEGRPWLNRALDLFGLLDLEAVLSETVTLQCFEVIAGR